MVKSSKVDGSIKEDAIIFKTQLADLKWFYVSIQKPSS